MDIDLEHMRQTVRQALTRRRQSIVFFIAKQLHDSLKDSQISVSHLSANSNNLCEREWIQIESLSQLRSMVGGRFQKLKERWISAGFPLREHRGDRASEAEIDQSGWLELSLWINRQGYKTKLAKQGDPWLFEILLSGSKKYNSDCLNKENDSDLEDDE